ncbi:MAG: hypothetical protein ACI9F9_000395 [Candidatus Paceibacteria bacterium]|jgi:hypothetical protein
MSLINWIFDIYQHSKIDDARQETAALRSELSSIRQQGGGVNSDRLEDAMGTLALATKTMQRMMVEKGICSQSEFSALLTQVDKEDGRHDGKAPI